MRTPAGPIRGVLILLFLLSLLPSAFAIGIRPAKTEIAFDQLRDVVGDIWVVNNDQRELTVHIGVEGEMASYVTLDVDELSFRPEDDAKPVHYEVHLPESVPPGRSTANLLFEETYGGGSSSTTAVSSRVILKHKIWIEGPYPEKYVTAKLNFHDQGPEIMFVSEVQNLGTKPLEQVQTTFYVNDKSQQEQVLSTETIPLQSQETQLLQKRLPREMFTLGEYEVSAITTYDDQQVEVIKSLMVGEPSVAVTYFDQYFIAYTINQYSLDLLNKWNKQISNVFVDVHVKKDAQEVDTFRTRSVDLEAEMSKRIQDYFDAQDKGPGTYTFELLVNYWNLVRNQQTPYVFTTTLLPPEKADQRTAPPLVGQAAAPPSPTAGSLWLWLPLGMLLAGLACFVLWRYLQRNRYEGGDQAF